MGGRQRKRTGDRPGGIVGLADFVEAHKKAVEHDLLVQTGHTLEDVGRTLSWGALGSFLHRVKPDSAVAEEIRPDIAEWSTTFKTNVILADIYDEIANFAAVMAAKGTRHSPKKPKEYSRPWIKKPKSFKTVKKASEWFGMLGGGGKDGGGS